MSEFDNMAKDFDTEKRMERARAIADEIRLHIKGDKKTAIEFGCGTGLVGMQMLHDFDTVVFVDSSAGMIEQVQNKLVKMGIPPSRAVCCDIMTETQHDLHADCIFSSLVLHHIQDTETALSRLYNMLSVTGHLLIVDLDADDGSFHANFSEFDKHHGFEPSALVELAKKVGFARVEAKTFYTGSKTAHGQEKTYSLFILDAEK